MALKSRGLSTQCWQALLSDGLHSVRSLLCTAPNSTPHERLLNYSRSSSTGTSVPSWLCHPGPVLLKRHMLLQANPHYAHIHNKNGEETIVSTRHLAPVETPARKGSQDTPVEAAWMPQLFQGSHSTLLLPEQVTRPYVLIQHHQAMRNLARRLQSYEGPDVYIAHQTA